MTRVNEALNNRREFLNKAIQGVAGALSFLYLCRNEKRDNIQEEQIGFLEVRAEDNAKFGLAALDLGLDNDDALLSALNETRRELGLSAFIVQDGMLIKPE